MALSREEQETVIRVGYGDTHLVMSTTNPTHVRAMERRGIHPDSVSKIDGKPVAWNYKLPAEYLVLPKPKKRVTETQRQAAAERMKALRTAT